MLYVSEEIKQALNSGKKVWLKSIDDDIVGLITPEFLKCKNPYNIIYNTTICTNGLVVNFSKIEIEESDGK